MLDFPYISYIVGLLKVELWMLEYGVEAFVVVFFALKPLDNT